MEIASKILLGNEQLEQIECDPDILGISHYCVKSPKFSFRRLIGSDPVLGLEMASTGEVGCIGYDQYDALLKSMISCDFCIPEEEAVLLIVSEVDRALKSFGRYIEDLNKQGFKIYYYSSSDVELPMGAKRSSFEEATELISSKKVNIFFSYANPSPAIYVETPQSKLRKLAFIYSCSAILDPELSYWFSQAIINGSHHRLVYDQSLQEFHASPKGKFTPIQKLSPLPSYKKGINQVDDYLTRKIIVAESIEKRKASYNSSKKSI
jgi:hypothetical protein